MKKELRYYQLEAREALLAYFEEYTGNPLVVLPTGCHEKGQNILMYNGNLKAVEHIKVGDLLMGPDSTPRKVLSLCRGRQEMRKIKPVKGNSFTVNKDHILSLMATNEGKYKYPSYRRGGEIENISVSQYENKSNHFKHLHKLYRVAVSFPKRKEKLKLTPYFMGAYLGDGSSASGSLSIMTMDFEMVNACHMEAWHLGMDIRENGKLNSKASSYSITGKGNFSRRFPSPITEILKGYKLFKITCGSKFIPDDYKLGSVDTRLGVLAGLIDTDGSLSCGTYDYISKSPRLANDVAFVARSLGFAAYVKQCTKASQTGVSNTYYRVSISGDIQKIPVRIARKKAMPRAQKKNHLVTGFKIEVLPEDDYYGFTLDGDHLYLLDDFTVTHNTGKSLSLADFCEYSITNWPDTRILVVTHSAELITQNFAELVDLWPESNAGINSASVGKRDYHHQILFCGIQSVYSSAYQIQRCDLMLIDEAHLLSDEDASMYRKFIKDMLVINQHMKIVGYTATHWRMKSGLLTEGDNPLFTDVAYEYKLTKAVEDGYLAPLVSKGVEAHIDTAGVGTVGGDFNQKQLEAVSNTEEMNRAVVREALKWGANRRCWLTFATGVDHAKALCDEFNCNGISSAVVHGKTPKEERKRLIDAHKSGEIKNLVSVGVLTTGYNNPLVGLIIVTRATKSSGLYIQMLGRGTRCIGADIHESIENGKENCLVLDFTDNLDRFGPIDLIEPKAKRKGSGTAPVKDCPECKSRVAAGARECPDCGFQFPEPEIKINDKASTAAVMSNAGPVFIPVTKTLYTGHVTMRGERALRVEYLLEDAEPLSEMIVIESSNSMNRARAAAWWAKRSGGESLPKDVETALGLTDTLKQATALSLRKKRKYYEITAYKFA